MMRRTITLEVRDTAKTEQEIDEQVVAIGMAIDGALEQFGMTLLSLDLGTPVGCDTTYETPFRRKE